MRLKSPTPRLCRASSLRRYSNRNVWFVVEAVLEPGGDVGLLEGTLHLVADAAVWQQRDDRGGIEGAVAVDVEAQRRPVLHERSAQAGREAAELLGRLRARERVARVQHIVAQAEVGVAAPLREAGPRDDLHHHASRIVIVGREGIGPETDLADFVAVRQAAAAEAVHLEHRAGAAGHRLELRAQFVGVVRQLRDLVFFERRRQRVAAWVVGGRSLTTISS